MKLFRRKSRWARIVDVVTSAAAGGAVRKAGKSTADAITSAAARGGVRKAGKVSAGVVGGAVAATVASAAVSAARDRDRQA